MKKILIIDSDVLLLDDLTMTLSGFNIDVRTAQTGLEGIRMISREPFDMIITNLFVPCLDGNDVARHARLVGKGTIPIIGISDRPRFFTRSEFDRIIPRSISTGDLIQIVREYITPTEAVAAMQNPIPCPFPIPFEEYLPVAFFG
jgi:CheY-like chemotaxis protein